MKTVSLTSCEELLELYSFEEILELSNVSQGEALFVLFEHGLLIVPEGMRLPAYSEEVWEDDLEIEPSED